jgi:hypothetical protein
MQSVCASSLRMCGVGAHIEVQYVQPSVRKKKANKAKTLCVIRMHHVKGERERE